MFVNSKGLSSWAAKLTWRNRSRIFPAKQPQAPSVTLFAVSANKIPLQTQEGTLPPPGDSAGALFWDGENVTPSKVKT